MKLTINISDSLYKKLKNDAEQTGETIETIAIISIESHYDYCDSIDRENKSGT